MATKKTSFSRDRIKVRPASLGDAATLVRFNQRMALETEGKRLARDVLAAGVHAVLTCPEHGFYLVAEIDGVVAGSLMITTEWSDWRNGTFWWIQSVYVRPECRRRGVFRALHQAVKERAREIPQVCGYRLYVERDNAAAQRVYAKLGMTETKYKIFEEIIPPAGKRRSREARGIA